jgi:hypothetical protein
LNISSYIRNLSIFSNKTYDDGGPEYDWGLTSHHYTSDLGINLLSNLDSCINTDDTDLDIPNIDIIKMNRDKKFAFQIALKTFIEISTNYEPFLKYPHLVSFLGPFNE